MTLVDVYSKKLLFYIKEPNIIFIITICVTQKNENYNPAPFDV